MGKKNRRHEDRKQGREELMKTCPNCGDSSEKSVHLLYGGSLKDHVYGCANCWSLWDVTLDLVTYGETHDLELYDVLAEVQGSTAPNSEKEAAAIRRAKKGETKKVKGGIVIDHPRRDASRTAYGRMCAFTTCREVGPVCEGHFCRECCEKVHWNLTEHWVPELWVVASEPVTEDKLFSALGELKIAALPLTTYTTVSPIAEWMGGGY